MSGPEQQVELLTVPPGDKFLRWYGHTGRSYFLQASDPANHLSAWFWAPVIEAGNDEEISYEVDGTATKGFFRLRYTDQVPGPGETLETADFDNDGLSNWEEISGHATDPLAIDTDQDGFSDKVEIQAGTSPIDASSFPLKVIHSVPDQLATSGSAYGHPSGQPLILYLNKELPAEVTAVGGPWIYDQSDPSSTPAPGTTIILPGRTAIAFIPVGGSFKTWPEVADDTPRYSFAFDTESTGIPHLVPLYGNFTITSPTASAGHRPWIAQTRPGSGYIDSDPSFPLQVTWNEPLHPSTIIPGNVTLTDEAGTIIGTNVVFDYGRNINLLTITPAQPLAPATRHTVTLGTGFQNLTGKSHAAPQSWSFTTRPVRPAPGGIGPYVTAVSPSDFIFGIAPPGSVSITFSEDMDPATLIPENIRVRGWLGNVLPGTLTYTAATRTLAFLPSEPFTPHTYFSIEYEHAEILNLPPSDTPSSLQDTGPSVFATAANAPPNTGGTNPGGSGGGAPPPTALAPLNLHYTWGKVFVPPSGSGSGGSSGGSNLLPYTPLSGCSVDIKLIDKAGGETAKHLDANIEAVQVAESGAIAPATTVHVTPVFTPGTREADTLDEQKKNGVFILPTAGLLPLTSATKAPGMTYLVFRKTPASDDSSQPEEVEYLGPFGNRVEARCAVDDGRGPQTLYFVPVPIERSIPGFQNNAWNILEADYAKALPGQRMDLTVENRYLNQNGPPGATIDTFQWPAVDLGKTFKEFIGTTNNSIYQQIPPAELLSQTIRFYRTKGGETMAAKATYKIRIDGSEVGQGESIGKIRMDQPTSTFGLEIGEEKVMTAPDSNWNDTLMFGLFSKTAGDVFRGVKFNGMVRTPPGWSNGEWNFTQLVKSRRNYTYQGGLQTHLGDGQSLKLDTDYPYSTTFPADGTPKDDASCGDTPREPLTGTPPPGNQSTPRTQIEVHESFETFIMFQPPGQDSRYVPLRRAKWRWGGTVMSSNNWTPVANPEASNSDTTGVEHSDHPQWSDNTDSDTESAGH